MVAIQCLEYVRPHDGLGRDLFGEPLKVADFAGFIVPVGLSLLMGWNALTLNIAFAVIIIVLIGFYRKRIGGVTGDLLGATTEILEAVLFLTMSAGGIL